MVRGSLRVLVGVAVVPGGRGWWSGVGLEVVVLGGWQGEVDVGVGGRGWRGWSGWRRGGVEGGVLAGAGGRGGEWRGGEAAVVVVVTWKRKGVFK